MPIRFSCDGCGKIYTVPTAASGKRAKCAACGNISTVPAPAAGATKDPPAVTKTVPIPPPLTAPVPGRISDKTRNPTPPPTPSAVISRTESDTADSSRSSGRFYPTWSVLIALLLIAAAAAWWARAWPAVWYSTIALFPVLAVVFLLVGTAAIGSQTLAAPGGPPPGWKDLLILAGRIPLAVGLPNLAAGSAKRSWDPDRRHRFHREVSNLFFRSLAVALLSAAIVIVGYWSGDCPLNRPQALSQPPGQVPVPRAGRTPVTVSIPADMPDPPVPR